jgi:hypothetical protein
MTGGRCDAVVPAFLFVVSIFCHPGTCAGGRRDLFSVAEYPKQAESALTCLSFRSLSRASYFSLLVHCAACGANGAAGPKGEHRRCESRKGNQKKAFPAHARGAWALSHPRASGAQAGVFAPVGCARRCAPGSRNSRGFSTRRPCLVEKRAASCRAPCGPDPRMPPRPGVPVDQGQNQRLLEGGVTNTDFSEFLAEKQGSGLTPP